MSGSDSDKVILSCALTGAVTTKKHCPAIPYTPVEIAEEARRAYEAGAAVVHIHARTDDGAPTWDREVFTRIIIAALLVAKTTGLLDVSTATFFVFMVCCMLATRVAVVSVIASRKRTSQR